MTSETVTSSGRRKQLVCDPCRASKLRCDRKQPVCGQCARQSKVAACKYRWHPSAPPRDTARTVQEKLARLEALVGSLKYSRAPSDGHDGDEGGDGSDEGGASPLASHVKRLPNGSTQYTGPSHWESIIDDIADLRQYFDDGHDFAAAASLNLPFTLLFGAQPVRALSEVLGHLPPKADMDRYIAAWLHLMDPMRIILHIPTFQQECLQFWNNPGEVSAGWLSLLTAVACLGAQVSAQSGGLQPMASAHADALLGLASKTLTLAHTSVPERYVIEALLHLTKSLLFKPEPPSRALWQLIGFTTRLCHQAGYHRDPSHDPNMSMYDCEMRRRVWMAAREFEAITSYDLGMCCFINPRLCDTNLPSNLVDTDFSPREASSPRSLDDYTPVLTQVFYAQLVAVFGDVVVLSQAVDRPSKSEWNRLYERLVDVKARLPATLRIKPLDQSLLDSVGHIIDRFRLESLYNKAVCLVSRPFLGKQDCEEDQRRCLSAAYAILDSQNPMLEATQPGGQLAHSAILMKRHIYDFGLAATVLCSQLKHPSPPSAAFLPDDPPRIRAKLLDLCNLWQPYGLTAPKCHYMLKAVEQFCVGEFSPAQPRGAGLDAAYELTVFNDYPNVELNKTNLQATNLLAIDHAMHMFDFPTQFESE